MKTIIGILVIILSVNNSSTAQVNKNKQNTPIKMGRNDTTLKMNPDAPLKTDDSMYRDKEEDWADEYDTTAPVNNLGYPFDTTDKQNKNKAIRRNKKR